MSDSRITVSFSEVQAMQDLRRAVIGRIAELEAEDPLFSLPVRAHLVEAARALDLAAWPLRQALRHLGEADQIENRRSA